LSGGNKNYCRPRQQESSYRGVMLDLTSHKIVPARIHARMKVLGIGLRELARMTGVSYQLLQNLLTGTHKKNPAWAYNLVGPLQASWEYLTGQTDNPAVPVSDNVKDFSTFTMSNSRVPPHTGIGQEGPGMLTEISRMLGVMEGSLKTTFGARFDSIEQRLDNHDQRLAALEGGPISGPQKGRRR
jgi:hypothetical protein